MTDLEFHNGIAQGFVEGQLAHLDETDKNAILKLLARTSEASFRRGLQHGWHFMETSKPTYLRPADLRNGKCSLDRSPWIDSKTAAGRLAGTSALERLHLEYWQLQDLGLD